MTNSEQSLIEKLSEMSPDENFSEHWRSGYIQARQEAISIAKMYTNSPVSIHDEDKCIQTMGVHNTPDVVRPAHATDYTVIPHEPKAGESVGLSGEIPDNIMLWIEKHLYMKAHMNAAFMMSHADVYELARICLSTTKPVSLIAATNALINSLEYAQTQEWRDAELMRCWPYYSDAVKAVLESAKEQGAKFYVD